MARISGNVTSGLDTTNTSNHGGTFQATALSAPGSVRITFDPPFSETPSVLVNVINWDAETSGNTINVGVVPKKEYVDIEFWRADNYASQSFSFAAFGGQ